MDGVNTADETSADQAPVDVRQTQVGKGIFSRRRFQSHDIVGWITGEIIDDPQYGSEYGIEISDTRTLDPDPPFRYLNHSCDPNCEFTWFESDDPEHIPEVFLLALRGIAVGEQLTIDYRWPAACAIRCMCQAESCRGWIVCEEELSFLAN